MTGEQRRQKILKLLIDSEKPLPARMFAEQFHVSRQVIVGDIALLRAQGEPIVSSYKGYHLQGKEKGYIAQYVAFHSQTDTEKELETLVSMDVSILDVSVEHPVYGEIKGRLDIQTMDDVQNFMAQDSKLLSTLTDGLHIHTIACKDQSHFQKVLQELDKLGFLYKNE